MEGSCRDPGKRTALANSPCEVYLLAHVAHVGRNTASLMATSMLGANDYSRIRQFVVGRKYKDQPTRQPGSTYDWAN